MTTNATISFFETNTPGGGPFQGNLKLAYVPTSFNFGNYNSKGVTNATTYQQVITKDAKQYVAVSDDRDTKTAVWDLKAKVDAFEYKTTDANGVEQVSMLENAELAFVVGENQKYNIDTAKSDKNKTPSPAITDAGTLTTFSDTFYTGPAAKAKVTLIAGDTTSEKSVLGYAAPTHAPGAGTLGVAREISSVTLNVKDHSNVKDKTFSSTVHWTLAADVQP